MLKSVAKASGLNMLGALLPVLFMVPSLGVLSRELKESDFTVYLLFLSLGGASSLLDLGLSRAIVREVAQNPNDDDLIAASLGSSMVLVLLISLFLAGVAFVFKPSLVSALNSGALSAEALWVACILFFPSLPLMLGSKILLSVYEGRGQFPRYNIHRVVSGVLLAVLPVVFLYVDSPTLVSATLGLLLARVFSFLLDGICISRCLKACVRTNFAVLRRLLVFGSWASVSGVVSPVLSLLDRFFVNTILPGSVAAYYIVAADFVGRLSIVPASIGKVLFSRYSAGSHIIRVEWLMLGVLLLFVAPIYLAAGWIIEIWLGGYAEAADIIRILLLGFIFNALAQIPYAKLHAAGFVRVVAVSHMLQAVIYIPLLWWAIEIWGVLGAAWLWVIRVVLDWLLLVGFRLRVLDV